MLFHYYFNLQIILKHLWCGNMQFVFSFCQVYFYVTDINDTHALNRIFKVDKTTLFMMNALSLLHPRKISEHYIWSLGTRIALKTLFSFSSISEEMRKIMCSPRTVTTGMRILLEWVECIFPSKVMWELRIQAKIKMKSLLISMTTNIAFN